jgi:quaternary ammonium compound-resistance protein SugE
MFGGENMAWIYLIIAGIFEVVWAMGLKYSHGFTKLFPSLITLGGMIISFYLLSLATKSLPIGTAYAIWTGIGALGAVLLGIILFNEPVNFLRILFLCFILTGILGLKFTSA